MTTINFGAANLAAFDIPNLAEKPGKPCIVERLRRELPTDAGEKLGEWLGDPKVRTSSIARVLTDANLPGSWSSIDLHRTGACSCRARKVV